jgi:hypothetical protein
VEKVFRENKAYYQAGIATFISDKANFRPNKVRRDKEDHFIWIKGASHQKETDICTEHWSTKFHIKKQLIIKAQTDSNTITVCYFNTPPSKTDRKYRPKKTDKENNFKIR